jgi:mannose-6-phosphate isomerase-like protein (cupin superfamily)
MQFFKTSELLLQHREGNRPYLEFLRESSMSCGLYVLPTDGVDYQQPHTEDEVYYVISGHGQFTDSGETHPVQPGSIIFVAAHAEHRFHNITEMLEILVFFAPAEWSQKS